jgi:hypothetical protein
VIRRAILLAALAAALPGCPDQPPPEDDIILYGLTTAPPGNQGVIVNSDEDGYSITMSRGVALGARCWDSCDYDCVAPHITAGDETVLALRPMWRPTGGDADRVLIAMQTGTTELTVGTSCATRTYAVRVVDQGQ